MKLKPSVAGQFYPSSKKELLKMLEAFALLPAPKTLSGDPVGLMLPHAGYVYSGATASLGYRSLPGSYETVVVIGPSHRAAFKGCAVFTGDRAETPLGDLAVDQEAARFLVGQDDTLREIPEVFAKEHSVEVHFPFLQKFLPEARVVPVVAGQDGQTSASLAKALSALRRQTRFLLVASSDLSHYPDYATAVEADGIFLQALLTGDEQRVARVEDELMNRGYREYHCTHCGAEPVSALLKYAKAEGAGQTTLIDYRNSGDVTGDKSQVVGYAAVAFCKKA